MKSKFPALDLDLSALPVSSDGKTKALKMGNIKGNHFYNALKHKRVNGKLKVRGERKEHYSPDKVTYSVSEWKDIKQRQKNETEKINKENYETAIKTNS
jgi:hypothetical protein